MMLYEYDFSTTQYAQKVGNACSVHKIMNNLDCIVCVASHFLFNAKALLFFCIKRREILSNSKFVRLSGCCKYGTKIVILKTGLKIKSQ